MTANYVALWRSAGAFGVMVRRSVALASLWINCILQSAHRDFTYIVSTNLVHDSHAGKIGFSCITGTCERKFDSATDCYSQQQENDMFCYDKIIDSSSHLTHSTESSSLELRYMTLCLVFLCVFLIAWKLVIYGLITLVICCNASVAVPKRMNLSRRYREGITQGR